MMQCAKETRRAAPSARDFDLVRRDELAGAANHFDFALLRQRRESAGELADDLVLPFAQLRRVDLRLAEVHARAAHRFRFLDDLRSVQQRLGRNAADVETHTAELRPALDQRDLHAEVGSAKRSCVTAGTGAEHDDFEVVGRAGGRGRRLGRLRLRSFGGLSAASVALLSFGRLRRLSPALLLRLVRRACCFPRLR